jgi:hypothetical protein
MFSEKFGWHPIEMAPIDKCSFPMVRASRMPSISPFKLTAAGWVSSGKGTALAVTPLWKPYIPHKR